VNFFGRIEPVSKLIDSAEVCTGLNQDHKKNGQKPVFFGKSKEAVPKAEVLEQPQLLEEKVC
jgi:hypothetical protein